MTTRMDPNSSKVPPLPTTKIEAAKMLAVAGERLGFPGECYLKGRSNSFDRDYNDHKAKQWFEAMFDLLVAEAYLEAWRADLGFNGECGTYNAEDSSIGGVPCISSEEE